MFVFQVRNRLEKFDPLVGGHPRRIAYSSICKCDLSIENAAGLIAMGNLHVESHDVNLLVL